MEISDDEKLNAEIRERIAYEKRAYECFVTGHEGCIYIYYPDDEEEYNREYFASAEKAVSYGKRHCVKSFKIEKAGCMIGTRRGFQKKRTTFIRRMSMRSCHGTNLHRKEMSHMALLGNIKSRLMLRIVIDLKICICISKARSGLGIL